MVKNRKKILILGATGKVGSDLFELFLEDFDVFGTYLFGKKKEKFHKIDLLDKKKLKQVIKKIKPDVVINTVGIPSPDVCEKNKKLAYNINYKTAENVADVCNEFAVHFIYISTNAVLYGDVINPNEEAIPDPINYYGITKLLGEVASQAGIIVRIPRVIFLTATKDPLLCDVLCDTNVTTFDNIHVRKFIWTRDLYIVLKKLIQKNINSGVYHACTDEAFTKYELAKLFIDTRKLPKKIKPGKVHNLAKRKIRESLQNTKIKKLGIKFTSFKEIFQDERFYSNNLSI